MRPAFVQKELRRPIPYCPVQHKPCYDKRGAQTAANHAYETRHQTLRIYSCPHCQFFHLTHHLKGERDKFFRNKRPR